MWPFGIKKTLADSGLLNGFIDNHCHLLPGIDDGVREIDETLEILADLETRGVKEVWLTPHTMEDIPNTAENLKDVFKKLQEQYIKESDNPIKLHLSSEYMIDPFFEKQLKSGNLLPHRDGMLLVETSYVSCPFNFRNMLEEVKRHGYFPLLAHPERYIYMEDMDEYDELKEKDIRFQLNLSSIVGSYGEQVQKKAKYLLKKGYYDYVGTDTHALRFWQRVLSKKSLGADTIKRLKELMEKNNQYQK